MYLLIVYKLQTLFFSTYQVKVTVFARYTSLLLLHKEGCRRAGEVDCGHPGSEGLGGWRVPGGDREGLGFLQLFCSQQSSGDKMRL